MKSFATLPPTVIASPNGAWRSMDCFAALAMTLMVSFFPFVAQAEVHQIDPRVCEMLHEASKVKGAAYEAGVDSDGFAVVPADVPRAPLLPSLKEIKIPLQVDVFKASGFDNSAFPFSSLQREDINLGTLTLRDHQLFFNDKKLTSAQEAELQTLCNRPEEKTKEQVKDEK